MRPPRFQVPGGIFHVTTRGVAGCLIFVDDADRESFLAILGLCVSRHGWEILDYSLMGTHYHLIVRTPEANLSRGMQLLNGCYARSFNHRYGRRGHLFGDRFHDVFQQTDGQLVETKRYVANNARDAGLCVDPADHPWSGFAVALGRSRPPQFIRLDHLLEQFGGNNARARKRLAAFVAERPRAP